MDFSKLGAAAATADDLTQEKSFERQIPRAGVALLRLREYLELGRHASNNPAHKPSQKVILVFELSHPDHLIEVEGKKVPQSFMVRLNKGGTSKSGYRKLFSLMNEACGNKYNHFVQMIGEAFIGKLYHNKSEDGKQTYVNLDKDGAYFIQAPIMEDPITGNKTPVPVRELDGTPRAFLWENEGVSDDDIKAMWESIYIDGVRKVEDTKTKEQKEVSKNWIQETIMKNLEWEGSRTQGLVTEFVNLEEAAIPEQPVEAPVQQAAPVANLAASAVPSLDDL